MSDLSTRPSRQLSAFALIGFGILLLAGSVFNFSLFGAFWPLLVMLPGAAFLYPALTGGKRSSALAIPGSLIAGTGLILLYQNLTGHWASWAYIWTLYGVFLGWALEFMGQRMGNESEMAVGRGFIKYSLMSFAALFVLFEVLIFGSVMSGLSGILLPAGLIGAGAYMLRNNDSLGDWAANARKAKRNLSDGLPNVSKRKTGYHPKVKDPLREQIDEALAEIEREQRTQSDSEHV
jgi:hypothetical protein